MVFKNLGSSSVERPGLGSWEEMKPGLDSFHGLPRYISMKVFHLSRSMFYISAAFPLATLSLIFMSPYN